MRKIQSTSIALTLLKLTQIGAFRAGMTFCLALLMAGSFEQPMNNRAAGAEFTDPPPYANGPGGISAVKEWASRRTRFAIEDYASGQYERKESPKHWQRQVVYNIEVDRFNDGNPANNSANISEQQLIFADGDQRGLVYYRHGGDLQGVIDRLDYLEELGITLINLSPILHRDPNTNVNCVSDPTQIDANFGDQDTLRKLTKLAHAKGIRVVLEIVVHQLCGGKSRYDQPSIADPELRHQLCVETQEQNYYDSKVPVRGQLKIKFDEELFPAFRHKRFYSRCGMPTKLGRKDFANAMRLWSDSHSEIFDFDSTYWDFQEVFVELHKYWLAYADVDGYRLVGAESVAREFVARFASEVREFALRLGKSNFLIAGIVEGDSKLQHAYLGEMVAGNETLSSDLRNAAPGFKKTLAVLRDMYSHHPYSGFPGLNSVTTTEASEKMRSVQQGRLAPINFKHWYFEGSELESSQCSSDFCNISAIGGGLYNWNTVENPKQERFADGMTTPYQLYNAVGHLLTGLGVPVLYYGIEQGLNGRCPSQREVNGVGYDEIDWICKNSKAAQFARTKQDMFSTGPWRLGSQLESIHALSGIGINTSMEIENDPFTQLDAPYTQHVQKLIGIRRTCLPLSDGRIEFRAAHGHEGIQNGGFLAFSRIFNGVEVLVLLNSSASKRQIHRLGINQGLRINTPGQTYVNLIDIRDTGTVNSTGDFIEFSDYFFGSSSVAIFVPAEKVKQLSDGSGRCKLY